MTLRCMSFLMAAAMVEAADIWLVVENRANTPGAAVNTAMITAARLLAGASVQTSWKFAGDEIAGEREIFVRLLTQRMAAKIAIDGVCGLAVAEARIIWISVECAAGRAGNDHQDRLGRFLGHVIAHEVGHVILADHSHEETGLMSANWGKRELADFNGGRLRFNSPARLSRGLSR